MAKQKYLKVVIGGTFDEFHLGHKILIKKALEIGDQVIIGITTKKMLLTNPKNHEIASFKKRLGAVVKYLNKLGEKYKVHIIPIDDPYGPTLTDTELQAIIVSTETASIAKTINEIRVKNGLKPLRVEIIEMVLAEDNHPISTTRIKHGEIDINGKIIDTT